MKTYIFKVNALKIINNVILNHLKISKAKILRALYLIPLDFLIIYKFRLEVDKELVKKWKLAHYLSQGHRLLIPALTIKTKEKESTLKLVTLAPLLLPFKKVKGLNTKMLYSLFIFKSKVPEIKGENFEFNGSMSLEDIFTASFF